MSSVIRLYICDGLAEGIEVELTEKQHHHLCHVMRRRLGDEVALFNGRDGEWQGAIMFLSKKSCRLVILKQLRQQTLETDLWLVFALLKRGPIDFVAEKASEMGVSRLCPVITGRTNVARVNLERLRTIMVEAAEQCGRLTVPEIDEPKKLDLLLSEWPDGRGLVLLDESGAGKPIAEVMGSRSYVNGDAILIGPEGGFEPSELKAMRKLFFVTPTGIGRRLLRAETAAVAAIANWQALAGDWSSGPNGQQFGK